MTLALPQNRSVIYMSDGRAYLKYIILFTHVSSQVHTGHFPLGTLQAFTKWGSICIQEKYKHHRKALSELTISIVYTNFRKSGSKCPIYPPFILPCSRYSNLVIRVSLHDSNCYTLLHLGKTIFCILCTHISGITYTFTVYLKG